MAFSPESRRDQEEGGELDSHEEASPEEIKGREVELGLRDGLLLLQLFPNGGATDTALTFCCSGGGPRQPHWSFGLAPVSRFHSASFPLFPLCPMAYPPPWTLSNKVPFYQRRSPGQ